MDVPIMDLTFHRDFDQNSGISAENRHLLVLDGHNSHVTLEVVTLAMNFGLDIISLPSHTSYALQPLDVSCFKDLRLSLDKLETFGPCSTNTRGWKKQIYASGHPKHSKNHSQTRTLSLVSERLGFGHTMNMQCFQACNQVEDLRRQVG